MKQKLMPVLASEWRTIGPNPDLGEINSEKQQCVDHHVFRADDGLWHLWGCIRSTKVGRILYHWRAPSITDSNWEKTGEMIRVDHSKGESIDDWSHEEWIQSPFVVKENGQYYMFFGGHATGVDYQGNKIAFEETNGYKVNSDCQMCLLLSKDGVNWERYVNEEGKSRVFMSPGEVRDPCLIKIGDTWHMYYAGNTRQDDKYYTGTYLRTSKDLLHWSDYKLVAFDPRHGLIRWNFECPFVVERGGYYYLFVTKDYASEHTLVYRSEDPTDFGIGDAGAAEKFVCRINVGAPEIIIDEKGDEYITSNHDLHGGTCMCSLKWVEQ